MAKSCLSRWLFSWWHDKTLPTELPLTYALGIAALSMVPRERYVDYSGKRYERRLPGSARHEVGKYIRDNIGVLLRNIQARIEKEQQSKIEMMDSMMIPLDCPDMTSNNLDKAV